MSCTYIIYIIYTVCAVRVNFMIRWVNYMGEYEKTKINNEIRFHNRVLTINIREKE